MTNDTEKQTTENELRAALAASENFAKVQTDILRKVAKALRFEADAGGVSLAEHAVSVASERDYLKRREVDIIEAVTPVCDGGQCRVDIVTAFRRVQRERDEAVAALGAVGIELPYDPRDGDCGTARNAMSHVPESHEIAKLLGYCAALVARRDAIAAWQNHREHVGADSDEYAALIEARSKANDAASEAMARIGDLAPEVVRTLQAERDALKSGIVGFVHGAMPRMPLSLTSAVHGLLALVKS